MRQTVRLTESELRELIKECIHEIGVETDSLYTDDINDDYTEAIDFDVMQDIFKQFGVSTIGSREVENPQTGETGTRYELDVEDIDKEALENALKSAANNPEGIVLSLGQHRNAPEIKRWSVVVLNY